jgi:MFS superfamily sulfate permease-like transporter
MMIFTVALITSVQSLLSAVAIDKMHTGPRTDLDREMIGLGSANVLTGLLGGLPVAGVIVRSSTNVAAGARSRASAILHGVWVLVFSVALVSLVEQIPLAALAGLLIVIGMQLVKLAHIRLAHRTGDLLVYLATLVSVIFLNLLEGVLIGLALAFALLVWRIVRVAVTAEQIGGTDRWLVRIDGSCTFLCRGPAGGRGDGGTHRGLPRSRRPRRHHRLGAAAREQRWHCRFRGNRFLSDGERAGGSAVAEYGPGRARRCPRAVAVASQRFVEGIAGQW